MNPSTQTIAAPGRMFLPDDGGRAAAGFKGATGDCGVRAAAIATAAPYRDVYRELFDRQKAHHAKSRKRAVKKAAGRSVGASPRGGIWKEVLAPYLVDVHGAEYIPLAGIGKPPVRVRDVAARWPNRRVVMQLARHWSAMVNGVNRDSWEQHPEKRVYAVWILPEQTP